MFAYAMAHDYTQFVPEFTQMVYDKKFSYKD